MMKKLVTLLLALAMCMGMILPAFAADFVFPDGYEFKPVSEYIMPYGQHYFHNGLMPVLTDYGWRYVNTDGDIVDFGNGRYVYVFDFSEGYAPFINDDFKLGYMDANGKVVVAPQYDVYGPMGVVYAGRVINGNALVYNEALQDYEQITMTGKKVTRTLDPDGENVIYSDVIGNTAGATLENATISGEEYELNFSEGYAGVILYGDDYMERFYVVKKAENKPVTPTPAPVTPAPSEKIAYASTQTVSLDGKSVTLEAYALKDANGNDTNYVKLRDVAFLLNGTKAQFEVGWNGNVNIITGSKYTANGTEMNTPFSGNREYTLPTAVTNVNGTVKDLAAICLTDDAGGGYTYYQLRDLGRHLGFNVGWSGDIGIFIETDKPYTDAN